MATNPNEVTLHTTITGARTLSMHFGPPGQVDYRSHPGKQGTSGDAARHIFRSMVRKEVPVEQDLKALKGTVYSPKNRRIITKWIRDVCNAFTLRTTTMCLAVQLTDCYSIANKKSIPVANCQLYAIAGIWLAAKFEEMDEYLPQLKSLVDVCDKAYSAQQIVAAEEEILHFFRWKIPHTTAANFSYFYLHLLAHDRHLENRKKHFLKSATTAPPSAQGAGLSVCVVQGDAKTKGKSATRISISMDEPLLKSLSASRAKLKLPSSGALDVFEVYGTEDALSLAVRVTDLEAVTPRLLKWTEGQHIFVAPVSTSCIFTERGHAVILRPLNMLFLHLVDTLLHEYVTHVEFNHYPSHIVSLVGIVIARCLLCRTSDDDTMAEIIAETQELVEQQLGQSLVCVAALKPVAELLAQKYKDNFNAGAHCSLPEPVVAPPDDLTERVLTCLLTS